MSTQTPIQTAVAPPPELPVFNPDNVIITCPLACDLHGFTKDATYPTMQRFKKIEGARDDNGFNIYVMSVKWNEPVWLSSIEYKLNETN